MQRQKSHFQPIHLRALLQMYNHLRFAVHLSRTFGSSDSCHPSRNHFPSQFPHMTLVCLHRAPKPNSTSKRYDPLLPRCSAPPYSNTCPYNAGPAIDNCMHLCRQYALCSSIANGLETALYRHFRSSRTMGLPDTYPATCIYQSSPSSVICALKSQSNRWASLRFSSRRATRKATWRQKSHHHERANLRADAMR